MSTILKALRRLEDKKADAAQRPLKDEVVVGAARRRSRRGLGPAIVAGLALAFAGIALLWALDPDADFAAAPTPAVSAPPSPAQGTPPEAASFTPGEEAYEDDGTPDFEIVRPDPNAAPRALTPPPLPRLDDEAPRRRAAAAETPPSRRHEDAPVYEPTPERVAEPESGLPVYEEEPFYDEPAPVVAAKPRASVRVARTQWHPDPDRRLAWVEVPGSVAMREVREGERIGPYVVREIEPAAVLFADGGVEVRREIGN